MSRFSALAGLVPAVFALAALPAGGGAPGGALGRLGARARRVPAMDPLTLPFALPARLGLGRVEVLRQPRRVDRVHGRHSQEP